jgi:thymidylate synthase
MEISILYNEHDLIQLYQCLDKYGHWTDPRGEKTLEIENFTYTVGPNVRFNSFKGRNFNLKYLKREMAWYINADPTDLSIAEHAAQWGKIVANGRLNSNYGSYWFGCYGVKYIVNTLSKDPMSRRAVIPMYGTDDEHMDKDAKDVPCTIAIEFRIRNGRLNTRVIMRSQDILWGMGNDLPTFSFLQEIVATLLNLQLGTLTISVGSFHVYKSRFEMFKNILRDNTLEPIIDKPPAISRYEAHNLIEKSINPTFPFSKWLLNI